MSAMSLLVTILQYAMVLFCFGFIIFFHELGHLLVALWRGLHVERFSVGFGHAIFKRTYKGIDYIIGWIPLGGYVALPQLDAADEVPQTSDGKELPVVSPLDRILVAVAGPAFNIMLGFFLAIFVWHFGVKELPRTNTIVVAAVSEEIRNDDGKIVPTPEFGVLKPGDVITKINGKTFRKGWAQAFQLIVFSRSSHVTLDILRNGEAMTVEYDMIPNPENENLWTPNFMPVIPAEVGLIYEKSPALQAGVKPGDTIVSLNGETIANADQYRILEAKLTADPVNLVVNRDGKDLSFALTPSWTSIATTFDAPRLGIAFAKEDNLVVSSAVPGFPGEAAGVLKGDKVLSLNGQAVSEMAAFIDILKKAGPVPATMVLMRGEEQVTVTATPVMEYEESRYMLGIGPQDQKIMNYPTPNEQFLDTIDQIYNTVRSITNRKSAVGVRHMSTFPGIVAILKVSFSENFMNGVKLLVFINFMLAIVNLFPLPILDGGHITFGLIEMISRRRLPVTPVRWLQYIFATLLIGFTLYVMFYDVRRLPRVLGGHSGGSDQTLNFDSTGKHPAEPVPVVDPVTAPATPIVPAADPSAAPAKSGSDDLKSIMPQGPPVQDASPR